MTASGSASPLGDVSRETRTRLNAYADLLRTWNPKINLVSRTTIEELWPRHIEDSAQLIDLAPEDTRHWVDIGSGGGFPGLVIAILAKETRPELSVTLVESDQRKAVFLRTVVQKTGINASVVGKRIEAAEPLCADVLSARALAPLTVLLGFAERHLAPRGICLFPKGAGWRREVHEALEQWRFRCEDIPSATSPEAAILKIGEIQRV